MNRDIGKENLFEHVHRIADWVLASFPERIRQESEDIAQEAILNYLSKVNLDEVQNPAGYIRIMIQRIAIDRLRRMPRQGSQLDYDVADLNQLNSSRQEELEEMRSRLATAMEQMTEEEQSLISEFYIEGLSISVLASKYEKTYSAMAVQLHRIKNKLRCYANEGGDSLSD